MYETCLIKMPNKISTAFEVISGVYGNGEDRKNKLEKNGYNYREIQNCVNELINLFNKYKD